MHFGITDYNSIVVFNYIEWKPIANYVHILEGLKDNSLGEYQFDKLTLGGGKD